MTIRDKAGQSLLDFPLRKRSVFGVTNDFNLGWRGHPLFALLTAAMPVA